MKQKRPADSPTGPPPAVLRRQDSIDESSSFVEHFVVIASWIGIILTFPVSLFFIYKVVPQFFRAIILRNGRVHTKKAFGPGLVMILPCVDDVQYIDLRTVCYAVPPQEALTKDSLSVSVDAVVFYEVFDPMEAVLKVADYHSATQLLAATTLRNSIGTRSLAELLAERPIISNEVFAQMRRSTNTWGIKVTRVDIKDIRMPQQLQKAMAAEAESSRLANAKIIVAKAEIEATKSLQKATMLLSENPYSMQLRYLQSLHTIASDKTHTMVIPISTQLYRKVLH